MTRLQDVNTVDIQDAVRAGCRTMARGFNRHDADRPFFGAFVRPKAWLGWSEMFSDAHVPGRHLNALVAARETMGVDIDEEAVRKHAQALFFSNGGESPSPLNRASIRDRSATTFVAHNLREGFHGLNAIIWAYEDERALALAQQSIEFILRNWHPARGWLIRETPSGFIPNHLVSGIGRAIGPLVKIYRNTQHRPVLELAQDIAGAALECFPPDGRYPVDRLGDHVHSVTSTLSSLAQPGEVLNDQALLRRVAAFYDHALWKVRDETGWAIESTAPGAHPDRGEVNSSGDNLETALVLGAHLDARYFGDAERILRCHVLPSQLCDISFAPGWSAAKGSDSLPQDSVYVRLQGAWGFPAPYGHEPVCQTSVQFNLDIVGGTVASLCEFYRRAITQDEPGSYRLHCLLELDRPAIQVRTPYSQAALSVRLGEPGAVAIRVPNWFAGDPAAYARRYNLALNNGYWRSGRSENPLSLELPLHLERRTLVLKHRTRGIEVNLAGDSVESMDDHGADLTFFASPSD